MADRLLDDPRCSIVEDDFFARVGSGSSVQRERYDVILLDIDHSPGCWLQARHAAFYKEAGLRALADCLRPGGVFGLWSAWKPSAEFLDTLGAVFPSVREHPVSFFNPHVNETDSNWVIIAALEDNRPEK
jgi:spermidine synthase